MEHRIHLQSRRSQRAESASPIDVADLQQGEAGGRWLGEAADDSDLLFNALEEMDSSFYMEDFRRYYVQGQKMLVENNAPGPLQDPYLVEALKKLFAHPWFIRVWVLQEVALASSVRVLCGSQDIPLDKIFAIQWARSASRTANSQIHKES